MVKEILTQLGSTAIIIGVAGWFLRTLIIQQFERFRAKNAHDLDLKLEGVRAEWAKEVARLNVHEDYLHQRRVKLLEEMYSNTVEAEFSLQNFLVSWWAQSNQEELLYKGLLPKKHFNGDQSKSSMQERGEDFCKRFLQVNSSLHRNGLFFNESFIEGVKKAYEPFFQLIVDFDYESPPPVPKEFKDVINTGRVPRKVVTELFRNVLGVE